MSDFYKFKVNAEQEGWVGSAQIFTFPAYPRQRLLMYQIHTADGVYTSPLHGFNKFTTTAPLEELTADQINALCRIHFLESILVGKSKLGFNIVMDRFKQHNTNLWPFQHLTRADKSAVVSDVSHVVTCSHKDGVLVIDSSILSYRAGTYPVGTDFNTPAIKTEVNESRLYKANKSYKGASTLFERALYDYIYDQQ